MADERDNEDLKGYYVIKFEKFIDLMDELEHKYQITADLISEKIKVTSVKDWDNTPIVDLMRFFVEVSYLRDFLEGKINNPPEEEVKLVKTYDIKDVLMTTEDLARLNMSLFGIEELEGNLEIDFKISVQTH